MRRLVAITLATLLASSGLAQERYFFQEAGPEDFAMPVRLGHQDYRVDSAATGTLGLDLEALAFFKDNEFDGNVQRGYSLPGVRLQPRLTYTPIDEVKLELGLHATIYSGANKYPCYVYHDIATWKGDQYQSGAHLLPFFRATARFSHVTVAVGDIYGGTTHRIAEPLYNPELILSDDPEMGCQVLIDTERWHSDLWLNWQSYIFQESTHQEAFTVGWAQRIRLLRRQNALGTVHTLSLPILLLVQHRGGEQDNTHLGVQTIANGALGLRYDYLSGKRGAFTGASVEALALACIQQSGKLWPFKRGAAMWVEGGVYLLRDLHLSAGVFYAKDFCSLYGSPYYGTLSTKHPGARFSGMFTTMLSVEYSRTFAKAYTIGAHLKAYLNKTGTLTPATQADATALVSSPGEFRTPFSFGVYFRLSPSFVLVRKGSGKLRK